MAERSGGSTRFGRRLLSVVAAVTAAALALAGCGASDPSVKPPPASMGTALNHHIPSRISQLQFTDAAGKQVRLSDFHGKVLLIDVFMTLCQETCPLDTANLVDTARAVRKAGLGDQVEFASITVDPKRDTPARLAAYRKLFTPAPADWTTLTASPATIHTLWHYLGVFYQKQPEDDSPAPTDWMTGKPLTYDVSHADELFFVDTSGNERFVMSGMGHVAKGARLPKTLDHFLSDQGRKNREHPGADSWTVPQALRVIGWLTDHRIAHAATGSPAPSGQ